jgi:hypothetical protein
MKTHSVRAAASFTGKTRCKNEKSSVDLFVLFCKSGQWSIRHSVLTKSHEILQEKHKHYKCKSEKGMPYISVNNILGTRED